MIFFLFDTICLQDLAGIIDQGNDAIYVEIVQIRPL